MSYLSILWVLNSYRDYCFNCLPTFLSLNFFSKSKILTKKSMFYLIEFLFQIFLTYQQCWYFSWILVLCHPSVYSCAKTSFLDSVFVFYTNLIFFCLVHNRNLFLIGKHGEKSFISTLIKSFCSSNLLLELSTELLIQHSFPCFLHKPLLVF